MVRSRALHGRYGKPADIPVCLSIARWVAKGLYEGAVETLGYVGITDVITLVGHYTSVLMTLAFCDTAADTPGMAR